MSHLVNSKEAIQKMENIRDFIRWAITQFNQANLVYGHGTDNVWDEAVSLVLATLHLPPDIDANILDAKLLEQEKVIIVERVTSRVQDRIPVPYLVKEAWFAGLSFYIDERVIIPRSPIAELIEDEFSPWVEAENVHNILDLCTGSGCIAISAAIAFPDAMVDAVDISDDALTVAQINVERFGLEDTVQLIKSDVFSQIKAKRYDIIVANPPYVSDDEYETLPSEYKHEPSNALISEDDGLDIVKRILAGAYSHLTPQGILIVEVGLAQEKLEQAFSEVPFTWLQFENGGEGVFLLTAQELHEARPYFTE